MAKVNLYVIYDTVAGECGPVFSAINDGVAIRQVCTLMRDVVDIRDYSLVCVARMDTEDMAIEPCRYHVDIIAPYELYCKQLEERAACNTFIREVK